MKESKLIKQATDKNMPDLEKIRENILSGEASSPKLKVIRPKRLLAVAAVAALAIIGTVAAVANPGGVFFSPKPAVVATSTPDEATKAPEKKATEAEKATKASAQPQTKPTEAQPQNIAEDLKARINENVDEVKPLGKVGDYDICLAHGGTRGSGKEYLFIGDYAIRYSTQYEPYPLGIFCVSGDESYTLTEAYEEKVFDNFSEVMDILLDNEAKLHLSITENENTSELLRDAVGEQVFTARMLGKRGGAELWYKVSSFLTESNEEIDLGGYTLRLDGAQSGNASGLWVLKGDSALTLNDAVEQNMISAEDVVDILSSASSSGFNWKLIPPEEATTAPTEEETADDIS